MITQEADIISCLRFLILSALSPVLGTAVLSAVFAPHGFGYFINRSKSYRGDRPNDPSFYFCFFVCKHMIPKTAVAFYQAELKLPQPAVAAACFHQNFSKKTANIQATNQNGCYYLPVEEFCDNGLTSQCF